MPRISFPPIILIVLYLSVLTVAPARADYFDDRVDSIRAALRELISAATKAQYGVIAALGTQMLTVIDRLDDALSDQQRTLFGNIDAEREKSFDDIERTIRLAVAEKDLSLDRLGGMKDKLEATLYDVLRASKEPFVTGMWPTYIIPHGDSVIVVLKGKFLKEAVLRTEDGFTPQNHLVDRESRVAFSLPMEHVLANRTPESIKSITPITFHFAVPRPGSFWSGLRRHAPVQDYTLSAMLLPTTIADAQVYVGKVHTIVDERSKYDPPLDKEPFNIGGHGDHEFGHCVDPDPGWAFSTDPLDMTFELLHGGTGHRNAFAKNSLVKGQMCSAGYSWPDVGWAASVTWRAKGKMKQTRQVTLDEPHGAPFSIQWKSDELVRLPDQNANWHVVLTYKDGQTRVANRPDFYRYLRVRKNGDQLLLSANLVESNLDDPPIQGND